MKINDPNQRHLTRLLFLCLLRLAPSFLRSVLMAHLLPALLLRTGSAELHLTSAPAIIPRRCWKRPWLETERGKESITHSLASSSEEQSFSSGKSISSNYLSKIQYERVKMRGWNQGRRKELNDVIKITSIGGSYFYLRRRYALTLNAQSIPFPRSRAKKQLAPKTPITTRHTPRGDNIHFPPISAKLAVNLLNFKNRNNSFQRKLLAPPAHQASFWDFLTVWRLDRRSVDWPCNSLDSKWKWAWHALIIRVNE